MYRNDKCTLLVHAFHGDVNLQRISRTRTQLLLLLQSQSVESIDRTPAALPLLMDYLTVNPGPMAKVLGRSVVVEMCGTREGVSQRFQIPNLFGSPTFGKSEVLYLVL
jgi:hypothetical protein